ncbi:hypothetical protein ACF5W4_11100 [Bacillota bacterium Lsc_1132]
MANTDTKFISLEDILSRDSDKLTAITLGEFTTERLGTIPFASIDYDEYKTMKKDCMKMVPNGTGGMTPELDDDKLMLLVIIEAVDKDQRSTFTFRSKELLAKFGVQTAEGVAKKLLKPGEVLNFAVEVQNASGFGKRAQKETSEAVKNS